jgi:hypothetical protein
MTSIFNDFGFGSATSPPTTTRTTIPPTWAASGVWAGSFPLAPTPTSASSMKAARSVTTGARGSGCSSGPRGISGARPWQRA